MADPLEVLTMMFEAPCLLPAQKRTLWTIPSMVRPALSARRWGAGDLLIGLSPIMHRPCYYLVWIDATWFDGMWERDEFREALDDIWFGLEEEFGSRDSEHNGPYRWPEVDDEGGCCWFVATPDSVLTPAARKRLIPSFDATYSRESPIMTTPNTLPANGGVSDAANELIKDPLSEFVCSDCGTPLYVGHDCHKCGGFGADTPEQWAAGKAVRDSKGTPGKYDDVLKPFLQMMEAELHANCGKGDRPGWLSMTPQTALLEIYYHVSKLQKAVKNNDHSAIREYSADVANMSMMLLDVCVGIPALAPPPAGGGKEALSDAERLDWLQRRGATVSIVQFTDKGFSFQIGGIYATANPDIRAAIDAAIRAGKKG